MNDLGDRLPRPLPLLGRGVGQIYLQPHVLTGALIVLGIALYSPPMAVAAVLGTAVQTVSAWALGLDAPDRERGLDGYNGALVGCASWATFAAPGPAALATLVGAAACPAVGALLARLVGRRGLPVLTAPFCVVSGIVALLDRAVVPATVPVPTPSGGGAPDVLAGWLSGISQVVLVEGWLPGLVMLAGLFLAGWRVGLAAAMGSGLGTVCALVAGADPAAIAVGLAGFSPALTAIALAAVFLPAGGRAWAIAAAGAVVTWFVSQALAITPIPAYTWPFILTTWVALLIARRLSAPTGTPADAAAQAA